MKTEKNILVAFILNASFSIFEFFGGLFTGSTAILSDAVHDIGDAASIGLSYFLERKSKKKPDDTYTYGYVRYAALGGFITTLILLFGSIGVILHAIGKIIHPSAIHYDGMLLFAAVGLIVNFFAAYVTRGGHSVNQKAINLHMLEDVLGWLVVLLGAVIMRFTDLSILDPLLSIGVAIYIFLHAIQNLRQVLDLFLEKAPHGISAEEVRKHILALEGVLDVHHLHIWSLGGEEGYATLHIVTEEDHAKMKGRVREELGAHGISHATLEMETPDELCTEKCCTFETHKIGHHHHHHH